MTLEKHGLRSVQMHSHMLISPSLNWPQEADKHTHQQLPWKWMHTHTHTIKHWFTHTHTHTHTTTTTTTTTTTKHWLIHTHTNTHYRRWTNIHSTRYPESEHPHTDAGYRVWQTHGGRNQDLKSELVVSLSVKVKESLAHHQCWVQLKPCAAQFIHVHSQGWSSSSWKQSSAQVSFNINHNLGWRWSCTLWPTSKLVPLSSPNPAYYDPLLNLPHSPLPILHTMIHC